MKYLVLAFRVLTLLFLTSVLALAQEQDPPPDSPTDSDTVDVMIDEGEEWDSYDEYDDTDEYDDDYAPYDDEDYDYDDYDTDYEYDYDDSGFSSASSSFGAFGGATFELSDLDLTSLDSELDGNLIFFGGYGFAILDNWIIGGGGAGAELYDISEEYDEFTFNYGGFLTGYDLSLTQAFSVRLTLHTGQGEIIMIKKRPDLMEEDENELLERYREEDFYFFRPEFSVGVQPLPFFDIRLSSAYLYPIGGENVADLENLTYGIHLMFGFKFPGSPF